MSHFARLNKLWGRGCLAAGRIPSALYLLDAAWFPWDPPAFPWPSFPCSAGNPGSGGLKPHLSVLRTNLQLEHLLHPQAWAHLDGDFVSHAETQHPGSLIGVPHWPHVVCPTDLCALPYPGCHTPGRSVLYMNEMAFQCILIYCFASIPPNNPFPIVFYNTKLFAKPVGLYGVEPPCICVAVCKREWTRVQQLSNFISFPVRKISLKLSMLLADNKWLPITPLVSVTWNQLSDVNIFATRPTDWKWGEDAVLALEGVAGPARRGDGCCSEPAVLTHGVGTDPWGHVGALVFRAGAGSGKCNSLLPLERKSGGLNRNAVTQDGPVNTVKPFLK